MKFVRVVVWLCVAVSISFADNKQRNDKFGEIHQKGDSFFSKGGESDAETCRIDGTCEVSLRRNPPHDDS